MKKPNWEEKFDQIFGVTLYQEYKPKIPYGNEKYQYVSCGETVKDFIRDLLKEVTLN